MSEELRLRIQSGIVMAVVVLATTWLGGIAFRVLAAAIALLVFYEWSTMTRLKETQRTGFVLAWMAVVLIAAAVVLGFLPFASALLFGFTLLSVAIVARNGGSGWLPGGILYAGLSGISLAAIRGADMTGLKAMLVIFAVVWGTDILAYFVGRRIGGPKLAPRISPGKTWSGAIGGTVSGVALGLLAIGLSGGAVTAGAALLLFALSVFSQIGDLFESFIKRRFGVKDSSRLIPGHGGVMDRVDGLVFACFAAYLLAAATHAMSSCTQCSIGSFLVGTGPF
jgi:phosphatidate cytidylyltransferase